MIFAQKSLGVTHMTSTISPLPDCQRNKNSYTHLCITDF